MIYLYPNISSNYDLGTSNFKFKDLYLSGNSIYLNDIIISSNNSNFEFKKQNLFIPLNTNQINITSNNTIINLKIDNNNLSFSNKYPILLNNSYDNSNIIYSNVHNLTSNNLYSFTNNKFNSLNLDLISIGTSNRFITNDTYNRNLTITEINNLYNYIPNVQYNVNYNYQLYNNLTSGNIYQRYLKATFTGLNKYYNANTLGQSTYTISGIYPGDIIDISNIYLTNFADRFVGNNKPVYITNISLIGDDYFNYVIDSSAIAFSANIMGVLISVAFNIDKFYDNLLVSS